MIFNRIALPLRTSVGQVISVFSSCFHSYRSKFYKTLQDQGLSPFPLFLFWLYLPLIHVLSSFSHPGAPQACSYLRAFALLFPLLESHFHMVFSLISFRYLAQCHFLMSASLANWFKIAIPTFLPKPETPRFSFAALFFVINCFAH